MSPASREQKELSFEQLSEKEKILWDEIRNIREIALKLLQWGVTVLTALQTAIFFFRKDLYQRMIDSQEITRGHYIPWNRYLIGTVYLFFVATIFSYILVMVGNRYGKIRSQLVETNCYGIQHGDANKVVRYAVLMVFYAFPILDIVIRLYVSIDFGFK